MSATAQLRQVYCVNSCFIDLCKQAVNICTELYAVSIAEGLNK